MKTKREIRTLLAARQEGLTLNTLIFLRLLEKSELYQSELADLMDAHITTVRDWGYKLSEARLVRIKYTPAPTGNIGAPLSTLYSLTTKGQKLLNRLP